MNLKSEKKVVGSMDIKSFYPSIKPEKVALVCRFMWNKSGVKVENVDHDKLSKYIGKEFSQEKIRWLGLHEVVYTKKQKKPVSKKVSKKHAKVNLSNQKKEKKNI